MDYPATSHFVAAYGIPTVLGVSPLSRLVFQTSYILGYTRKLDSIHATSGKLNPVQRLWQLVTFLSILVVSNAHQLHQLESVVSLPALVAASPYPF